MPKRKVTLSNGETYHIFSRSIAKFKIFRNPEEFERIRSLLSYYYTKEIPLKFSKFRQLEHKDRFYEINIKQSEKKVQIIAYCIMPTHFHLILKQLKDDGISMFLSNILNSFTKYFNKRTNRKGPLWEGRFRNVQIVTDEQLIHLTRYIHLNPVTAKLVNKPEEWQYSSFKEYLCTNPNDKGFCEFSDLIDMSPDEYRRFVNSNIDHQRELASIKDLLLE